MVPDDKSSFILGKEMVQFGGGVNSLGKNVYSSLSIYGRPYSNYNTGCTLCIFSTDDGPQTGGGGHAEISSLDYNGGARNVANAVTDKFAPIVCHQGLDAAIKINLQNINKLSNV